MTTLSTTETNQENIRAALDKLASQGAQEAYPVRFFHIESLVNRAQNSEPTLQRILLQKAQQATTQLLSIAANKEPQSNNKLYQSPLLELTKALEKKSNRTVQRKRNTNFDDLIQQQENHIRQNNGNKTTEAKSQTVIEAYRDTIAQMNTKKFIQQVINEVPKDPGPLNAHKLVIKTLTSMQAISPSYLRRIVNQIDTMFYLHEAEPNSSKKTSTK